MRAGQLSAFDELILVFRGTEFCINESENLLSIDCLEIPLKVERFKEDIAWRIRVIKFNEEEGDLFSEILDYDFPIRHSKYALNSICYFCGIESIRFSNIDTSGLLKSVVLTNQRVSEKNSFGNIKKQVIAIPDKIFSKIMKVPFWKISFLAGAVSFPFI